MESALDVLVVAPHPDDAEISVGGTILACKAQGLRVGVVELTNGEPTPHGSPELREKETAASTAVLDLDYRENLENSGVETKTLLFVVTDGEDNSSKNPPSKVKNIISKLKMEEKSAFSFTSVLFGLGNQANFEKAQKDMGIEHLAKIGTSGDEIKRMIGFISQSISSVSAGKSLTPAF